MILGEYYIVVSGVIHYCYLLTIQFNIMWLAKHVDIFWDNVPILK